MTADVTMSLYESHNFLTLLLLISHLLLLFMVYRSTQTVSIAIEKKRKKKLTKKNYVLKGAFLSKCLSIYFFPSDYMLYN